MVRASSAGVLAVLAFAAGLLCASLFMAPAAPDERGDHLRTIEEMTRKQPDNPEIWIHLGNEAYDAGQPAKAVSAYERALALAPDNPDVHTDLGTAYRLIDKPEQAISHYDEALRLDPRHVNARLNKGIVLHFDLGRKTEARNAWTELLRLHPDARGPDGTPLREYMARLAAQ
jgi:tetratricopeptide (TPR) repeat protein